MKLIDEVLGILDYLIDKDYYKHSINIIKRHEGFSSKEYKDIYGNPTIGYGRNLNNGITIPEAELMLLNDINNSIKDLKSIFNNFDELPDNIKIVLIDMMYNLGINRFKTFKKMIKAINDNNWLDMIYEMKDSKWCKQLNNRCKENIELIKEIL